jgi:hypothetical protein
MPESRNASEESLEVKDIKGGDYPDMDDGTYEAKYTGLRVFMDKSPWGEKKAARLYFQVTRGKYKGSKASFKGFFIQDPETDAWVVGSKSKLAEAIRNVTGGSKTLDRSHEGVAVFINIKNKPTKKGTNFCFIDAIIPKPSDDREQAAPKAGPKPEATAAAAKEKSSGGDLISDLDALSDFNE